MKRQHPHRQVVEQGIALIAVLWIVAALSIVVTGVVHSVRSEVRLVGGARQAVENVALGEAAINLVLQSMVAQSERPARLMLLPVTYRGHSMVVETMPLTGLIDINKASVPLLARLYAVAGGLDRPAAQALAEATVQKRSERTAGGRQTGFEAGEDLLRVPGLEYALYARLSRLISAEESQGAGLVNPLAAPPEVLAVLTDGNTALSSLLAARRASGATGIDTSALPQEFIGNTVSLRYRLQARIALPDGAHAVVSRSVELRPDARLGLPWRIFNAEYWIQSAPPQGV